MLSGKSLARSFDGSTFTFGGLQGKTLVNGSCNGHGSCTAGGSFVDGPAPGQKFYGRPVSDAVSFKCIGGTNETETSGFQYLDCPYGLRAQLQFQTCWDGVNLYKLDNSHVSHMSQIDNGICPPTHPVQLVHLFFEVLYGVDRIRNKDGFFVFSNGDRTGYGFHGDFLNGWNMTTQTVALRDCANTDNNGQISACAPLILSNSEQSSYNCPERTALINETVHGTLRQLPGCNHIETGPALASASDHTCPPSVTQPALNSTSTSGGTYTTFIPQINKTYGDWTYIGCAADSNNLHLLSGSSQSNNSMTNDNCQRFCSQRRYPLAGLEYSRECYCGLSIASNTALSSDCNAMICSGNSSQYCGGPSRISIWNSTVFAGPRIPIPQSINDTLSLPTGSIHYLGCTPDNINNQRILTKATYSNTSNMTIEACANFCTARGAQLAGLEHAFECYCGDSLPTRANLGSATACQMNCVGNVTEICGGANALSVWSLKN